MSIITPYQAFSSTQLKTFMYHPTCLTRLAGPADHSEPSATSWAAPRSDSIVWVWPSPRSSECSPGTPVETRGPGQTREVW